MFILRVFGPLFGFFIYVVLVGYGATLINCFDITTPATILSRLSLIGGLIMVTFPFADALMLVYRVWTGKIENKD